MLDSEALSSVDVERHLGVPAREARRVLKERAGQGDDVPLKIYRAWLAPLWWWISSLSMQGWTVRLLPPGHTE